mmetsp:Transcript_3200/g.5287  ORF Transcript_3200/g.5287 Transcript_3200/m.5287 type:complete len:205 (-) Transcript_3200:180-794(-)
MNSFHSSILSHTPDFRGRATRPRRAVTAHPCAPCSRAQSPLLPGTARRRWPHLQRRVQRQHRRLVRRVVGEGQVHHRHSRQVAGGRHFLESTEAEVRGHVLLPRRAHRGFRSRQGPHPLRRRCLRPYRRAFPRTRLHVRGQQGPRRRRVQPGTSRQDTAHRQSHVLRPRGCREHADRRAVRQHDRQPGRFLHQVPAAQAVLPAT